MYCDEEVLTSEKHVILLMQPTHILRNSNNIAHYTHKQIKVFSNKY